MSHVIAIANHKGGVGKTTTAVNLGASLAAAERRVLIIDLDAQGNATSGLGVRPGETRASLYGVLMDLSAIGSAIHRSEHLRYLDIVPATADLAVAGVELAELPERAFRLRRALDGFRDLYDFILIDCPPALGLLTLNALAAADSVLVPLQPEFFAVQGLASFSELVRMVQERVNPRLRMEGVVLTLYDGRLKLAREVEAEVEGLFGPGMMRGRIPRNVTLAEAPGHGKPVIMYDAESPGARAYLALAQELIRGYAEEEGRSDGRKGGSAGGGAGRADGSARAGPAGGHRRNGADGYGGSARAATVSAPRAARPGSAPPTPTTSDRS